MSKLKLALAASGLLLFGGVTVWSIVAVLQHQVRRHAVDSVRSSLQAHRFAEALRRADELLEDDPQWDEVRWLAIRAALGARRPDRATRLLDAMIDSGAAATTIGRSLLELVDRLLQEGRLNDAESLLQRAVRYRVMPEEVVPTLVDIYVVEGRWEAARRCIYRLLAMQQHRVDDLYFLIDPIGLPHSARQQALQKAVTDPQRLALAHARRAMARGDWDTACTTLETILDSHPHRRDAIGLYGRVLAEMGAWRAFDAWQAEVAERDIRHPDVWLALARSAEGRGRAYEAVRAYWETLRMRPDDLAALNGLVRLLPTTEPEAYDAYARRRELVRKLMATAHQSLHAGHDALARRRLAVQCEQMGRYWEAWAWQVAAGRLDPTDVTADETARRLRSRLADDLPPVVERLDVAHRFRFDRFPLPGREATSPVSLRPPGI